MKRDTERGKTRNNLAPQFYGPPSGRGGPWRQNQMTTRTVLLSFPAYYAESYTDTKTKKEAKTKSNDFILTDVRRYSADIIAGYFFQLKNSEKPIIIPKQAAVSSKFSFSNQWHFILYHLKSYQSPTILFTLVLSMQFISMLSDIWTVSAFEIVDKFILNLVVLSIFFFSFIFFLKNILLSSFKNYLKIRCIL